MMHDYLIVIFAGLAAIFLYNFFAALLRSLGNSIIPLVFLAVSAVLNIVLDLWFVAGLHRGVAGAAEATVLSQYVSGIGIALYTALQASRSCFRRGDGRIRLRLAPHPGDHRIFRAHLPAAIHHEPGHPGRPGAGQQLRSLPSWLLSRPRVKIDAFAYLPVQDFGNAFSIFIAQNYRRRQTPAHQKGHPRR